MQLTEEQQDRQALVKLVLRLHKEGDSYRKIVRDVSESLGVAITRNVVAGIVYRNAREEDRRSTHLAAPRIRRKPGRAPRVTGTCTAPAVPRPAQPVQTDSKPAQPQAPEERPSQALLAAPRRRLTADELEPHHCRWPYGDPRAADFTFCGRARHPLRPYCAEHLRLAGRDRDPAVAP